VIVTSGEELLLLLPVLTRLPLVILMAPSRPVIGA
jgi:hypothetical protein